MIVLHALWRPGVGLRVWGERDEAAGGRRRGRSGQAPRPHPFACPADALHAALGGETPEPGPCVVLLPSDRRKPAPSPDLLRHGERRPGTATSLLPWSVPAAVLDAEAATALLLDLDSARGAHVAIGSSLAFLGEVAKLALELTARGRILPALERRDDDFVACWRPVISDAADAGRLRALERGMPSACRAEPPPLPAATVLVDALRALTDGCARAALPSLPLSPARQGTRSLRPGHAWLRALAGPDGRVVAPRAELAALEHRLAPWVRTGMPDPRQRYRTCFRLSAPPDEGAAPALDGGSPAPWRLDFLLQRTDDPSLLLTADEVWATRIGADAVVGASGETAQEWLLRDLGRAARVLPVIHRALRTARPTGLDLGVGEAHDFLQRGVPALTATGFGILVPPWWESSAAALGLRLLVRSPRESRDRASSTAPLGLGAICEYEWRLALGDESLSVQEFMALAERKEPLVRLRGRWVALDPDEVGAALRFLGSEGGRGTMTALEALRVAGGASPTAVDLPVAGIEVDGEAVGPIESLLSGDDRMEAVAPPAGFEGTLRPYQERGLSWLAFLDQRGIGACLADDMGLGKTVQLLALLLARPASAAAPAPSLLVCPMSVVGNWQHEAARFAPALRVMVHHGGGRLEGEDFHRAAEGADLVITTYALAARDRETLAGVPWHRVVLDEAQYIKNPSALQSRAVRSLRAARRVALTGTPVENRLTELWSIMDFLNPGLLGSARDFRERFATPIERFRDERQSERLRTLTRPFLLRRLKTDRNIIRDLPDKQEMKVYCNLTREQASLYQAVVDDMLRRIEESEGMERRGLILATMMKLKQVCNHPAQLLQDRSALPGRSGKLALLEEVLGEALGIGDRCLVFTQFAEMGEMLQRHLHRQLGCEVLYLHGGTRRPGRDEMVKRFQGPDGPPVFILSLKAGGTGLNLTAANQVVHFDRWWNPAVEQQATDRAYRIGQRRNVQVRKMVCIGTLEERIDLMIERKKELAERIVGTGEGWLTELSTAELGEIVRLSADAAAE